MCADKSKKNIYGIMMVVNFVFFALMHATFVGFTNDDSYFVILRGEWSSLLDLLVYRYRTDSSRVLSEAILFTLVKYPFICWQILDVLICVLTYHSLTVLLVNNKYSKDNVLVFLAFAIYPFMHMGSAGWICTSLNYLWPLATLLYVLSIAYRRVLYDNNANVNALKNNNLDKKETKKISAFSYIFAVLAMIFTANCEMSATVMMLVFALLLLYAVIEKRKCWYEIVALIIGLAGIIFALSAPGNDERTAMEAANWMPEFFDLSFFEKARLCSVFVFEHYVAIPDVIFFLFALILILAGIPIAKSFGQKIIFVVPMLIDVIFTGYYFVKDFILGHKTNYDFSYPSIYMTDMKTKILQMSEVAGLIIFILASVYTICIICNSYVGNNVENNVENKKETDKKLVLFLMKNKQAIWCVWTLAVGFAVRMALMLSPTMFSSWHRTLIFMYFAFLYNIIVIIQMSGLLEKKKFVRNLIYIVMGLGIIVNLILTVGLQIRKAG